MIKKQFTIYLENKRGVLASLTHKLAAARVNIEGISVAESTDVALVQLVVSNAAGAKKALKDAGFSYTVQDVAVVALQNEPGALARLADYLAKDGVNINYIYATVGNCSCGCGCSVVISAENLGKVERAWASTAAK